jgi:probable phosphoglycerate mutase
MTHHGAMPTRLLFVRHGESWHKLDGVLGGPRTCRGLTPLGRTQATAVVDRLGAAPVAVYSSIIPRAIETAGIIADALGLPSTEDCGLCTWHSPAFADGMPVADYQRDHSLPGGGIFRPFEEGNESWAELVVRTSRTIIDIADRHRGTTAVIVAHAETVNASFHALGQLPLMRSFDTVVDPASITEWTTDEDPTAAIPPARWTLHRFNG